MELIDKGVNLDERSGDGTTPLIVVAKKGKSNSFVFLLSKGANVITKTKEGRSALHFASKGYLDLVQFLVATGAKLEEETKD